MSGSHEEKQKKENVSGPAEDLGRKKPYVKPNLVVHGAVERITENTSQGPTREQQMSNAYYSQ